MKKTVFLGLLAVAMALCYISCKKDKNNTPQKSATELLTNNSSKQWLTTSIRLGTKEIIEDCEKDDVYTFYADKKFDISNFNKCNIGEPDKDSGTWNFGDVGKLNITLFGKTYELGINDINEHTFTISSIENNQVLSQTFIAK